MGIEATWCVWKCYPPKIASFSMMLSHWIWGFMFFFKQTNTWWISSNTYGIHGYNMVHILLYLPGGFSCLKLCFVLGHGQQCVKIEYPQNKMIYSQKRLSLPPKAWYEILAHGKQCMTPTSGLKGTVYFEWTMCISFKVISLCLMAF